ncbi:DUF1048 domain-containing protein [uncultured Nocardioides sp.]|uniref:DUF1048 domain-containing protein n=1 Tax=uncultured Nocardioides sp. TaxID=198441 RepID=UPI00261EC0E6|nr:DUF1048 domain-containing protein [uncultured Nocardioides sp.]
MGLTDAVSRMVGDKRRYKQYAARTRALPGGYPTAIEGLERYFYVFGPGDGEQLLQMLDDLGELFEQSAAAGTPVREVVGDDPVEFAEEFLRNYREGAWIAKERRRLVDAVDRATAEERSS